MISYYIVDLCVYIYIYIYICIFDSEESLCDPDEISLCGALEAGGP